MKSLFLKIALLLTPLAVLMVLYAYLDPFEVIKSDGNYYQDKRIVYNRDSNSTNIFLLNYPRYRYDSFIFGNSRSLAFLCNEWRSYLDSDRVFHFDASGESLFGVWSKVRFLDRRGVVLKNCLIVLDAECLNITTNSPDHILIKHPLVSGESRVRFHQAMLKAFLNFGFLTEYLQYKATGIPPSSSELFETREFSYDPVTNDVYFTGQERELSDDLGGYYAKRRHIFYDRETHITPPQSSVIASRQKLMLSEIKRVLDKHGTSYHVVVNPLYDQKPLSVQDADYLRILFGPQRVFDYSGKNRFTGEVTNYYETSHFRPIVACEIMAEIYGVNSQGITRQ
jgi:hypothetical protein